MITCGNGAAVRAWFRRASESIGRSKRRELVKVLVPNQVNMNAHAFPPGWRPVAPWRWLVGSDNTCRHASARFGRRLPLYPRVRFQQIL
jgi:hypothetical protein